MTSKTSIWDYSMVICLLMGVAAGNILGIFLGNNLYWLNVGISLGYFLGLIGTVLALRGKYELKREQVSTMLTLFGLGVGLLLNCLISSPYGMLAIILGTVTGWLLGQVIKKTPII
ncbi:hypothetical protein OZX60_06030 [Streptococcaceae bacterium ESL0687]|nr:hypothetical protein OZX60_06030 [Streptococcaceae bacterium ESL0687]